MNDIEKMKTEIKSMQMMIIFLVSQMDNLGKLRFSKVFPEESKMLDELMKR